MKLILLTFALIMGASNAHALFVRGECIKRGACYYISTNNIGWVCEPLLYPEETYPNREHAHPPVFIRNYRSTNCLCVMIDGKVHC